VPLSSFEAGKPLPVQFYFENGGREPTVILKVSPDFVDFCVQLLIVLYYFVSRQVF